MDGPMLADSVANGGGNSPGTSRCWSVGASARHPPNADSAYAILHAVGRTIAVATPNKPRRVMHRVKDKEECLFRSRKRLRCPLFKHRVGYFEGSMHVR